MVEDLKEASEVDEWQERVDEDLRNIEAMIEFKRDEI